MAAIYVGEDSIVCFDRIRQSSLCVATVAKVGKVIGQLDTDVEYYDGISICL